MRGPGARIPGDVLADLAVLHPAAGCPFCIAYGEGQRCCLDLLLEGRPAQGDEDNFHCLQCGNDGFGAFTERQRAEAGAFYWCVRCGTRYDRNWKLMTTAR